MTILANKKGKCTLLRKKKNAQKTECGAVRGPSEDSAFSEVREKSAGCATNAADIRNTPLSPAEMTAAANRLHLSEAHNRQKNYLLKEGMPVNFLVQLGIMTKDGKIHAQKYSKFRQINRFLEFVDDILPELLVYEEAPGASDTKGSVTFENIQGPGASAASDSPESRTLEIVDFGCGKSYLTFAVFYYLTAIKGLKAHITGIDLKKDVIEHCRRFAEACGYSGMDFICGDVADFKGGEHPDLVITLHACDTATDYALAYAVNNKAKCILSVPCCQHELNSLVKKQVPDRAFSTMFKYGIIRERLSALATDVLRAELLENSGYTAQILEFIDMEDTPKNLLIRAVKRDKPTRSRGNLGLDELKSALGQTITLEKLIK
ncbi:MAG: SAM-dependent methyltransferase [Treponemataceae bacterium]|nr:SAM-dependent methyltransferase [Treponemataceae bacterium]